MCFFAFDCGKLLLMVDGVSLSRWPSRIKCVCKTLENLLLRSINLYGTPAAVRISHLIEFAENFPQPRQQQQPKPQTPHVTFCLTTTTTTNKQQQQ